MSNNVSCAVSVVMISIKIQCGCGQRYAFEVEPVNGRMPSQVVCPVCGVDGTEAGNQMLSQSVSAASVPGVLKISQAGHSGPVVAPPPLPSSLGVASKENDNLTWYEHLWIALPLALIAVGGAIGGACGGGAWAINKQVFKKTKSPVLRYVSTGCISISAGIVYLVIASLFVSLLKRR